MFVFLVLILLIYIINGNDVETLDCIPTVMAGYDVIEYYNLETSSCNSILGSSKYMFALNSTDAYGIPRYYYFQFTSQHNLNLFKNNPWKYAPKFGGFCSWGTCCEKSGWPWGKDHLGPPGGPDEKNCGFRVHNGELYFNIWESYDTKFFSNAENNIKKAKDRWIQWFGSLEAGVFNFDCFSTSGWNYMDCVHKSQKLAPIANKPASDYPSCGVQPSGKPIKKIAIILALSCFICCLLVCIIKCIIQRYNDNKSHNKNTKIMKQKLNVNDDSDDDELNNIEMDTLNDNNNNKTINDGEMNVNDIDNSNNINDNETNNLR